MSGSRNRSYILVTPVHNEATHLEQVIVSVQEQTLHPVLWIAVDDGSTDESLAILEAAQDRLSWLTVLRFDHSEYTRHLRYAAVCRTGFDHAIATLKARGCNWEYVGLLDSDILAPPEYFLSLVELMEADSRIGIASGGLLSVINSRLLRSRARTDWPMGAARLWRRQCFRETGGYDLTPSPDSVSNVRALKHGCQLRRVESIAAIQVRPVGAASGMWHGHVSAGQRAHFLGRHFALVFLGGMDMCRERPYYHGVAYIWGFVGAKLRRQAQTEDVMVRNYFGRERPRDWAVDFFRALLRRR